MAKHPTSILNGNKLTPLFSLGDLHISDFLKPGEEPRSPKSKLQLAMDEESGLVQLTEQPDAEYMWGDVYWYKSGTNQFMRDALEDVVKATEAFIPRSEGGIWLDIAGNDGTLLSFVDDRRFYTINIDPSAYPEAEQNCEKVVKDYFSASAYHQVAVGSRAKVITCCAMFYDLSDPISFLKQVNEVLHETGVFVLQLSYTPLMLVQNELGNVCHEHIAYYTLKSLEYALTHAGLKVIDLELNNVNGGSIRVYAIKDSVPLTFKTQADRDIAAIRVQSLRDYEEANGLNTPDAYIKFAGRMAEAAKEFLEFLNQERSKGKVFYGYGASTKGNTMLQWLGLTPKEIPFIAERQERKVGLVCAGTNIPVCSEEQARKDKPDYMIVFPWHFISEFVEREKEYLQNGGKFVVLSPKFEVIQ